MKTFISIGVIVGMIFLLGADLIRAAEESETALIIKVIPRIIALPGNKVAKVPPSAARVRSEELKALNKKYNVTSIEKVFKLAEKGTKGADLPKGLTSVKNGSCAINLSALFTRDTRKAMEKAGKSVEQEPDTFILRFEAGMDTSQALSDYKGLEVINDAVEIRIKE